MNLNVSFRHGPDSADVVARIDARARRIADRFDSAANVRVVCATDAVDADVEVRARVDGTLHFVRGRAGDLDEAVDVAFERLRARVERRADRRRRSRRGFSALDAAVA